MPQAHEPYEATRLRHVAYARSLLPQYVERIRWSRSRIEAEQRRALRQLLRFAVTRSPWHRERLHDVDVERITPADLPGIPSMTKRDLMDHWDAIVTDPRCTLTAAETHLKTLTTDAYFPGDHHVISSGGSSGTRGVFIYDWHGWAICHVGLERGLVAALQRSGRTLEGPLATVAAYAATHASSALAQTFMNAGRPVVRAPVTLPLAEIIEILNQAQPSLLHCYASMLPALCEAARSNRLRIAPALIWTTSEPLLPEVRAATEATWRVPVLNGWAASESNGGAFSCLVGPGFHIGEDLNIIELVDEAGIAVRRGERSARIFLTNLYNFVMPLVRYEITDEFQLADARCSCGSSYLKVQDVQGRADDIFVYAGRTAIHPLNFSTVLGREPCIIEYQVRQTERGAAVDVVAQSDSNLNVVRRTIEARLTDLGLREPVVTVRRVESIARQTTGKLKRFVPLPEAAGTRVQTSLAKISQ